MIEREDNITIVYIENKKQFLNQVIEDLETTEGVMTVDTIGMTVDYLAVKSMSDVVKESNSNRYIWFIKDHN